MATDQPEPASPSKVATSLVGTLEPALKAAALIGIGLYSMGLLVFNVWLAKYGVTDFAALKPQCLFTGTWSLMLLLLAALPVAAFNATVATGKIKRWKRLLIGSVLAVAAGYLTTILVHVLFSVFLGGPLYAPARLWAFDPGLPGWRFLLGEMTFLGIFTFSFIRQTESQALKWYLATLYSLMTPSILGLLIIGHDLCESVNQEMGGGKPSSTAFYFGPDGQSLLKFLKSNATPYHDDEPENVIQGELIYGTADRYVVRIIACRPTDLPATVENLKIAYTALTIDKKLIQSVFYTGQRLAVHGAPCPMAERIVKEQHSTPTH